MLMALECRERERRLALVRRPRESPIVSSSSRSAAERIPAAGRFDLVMVFNWIQDMANPRGAPANIQRAQAGRRPDVVRGERFGPTSPSLDPGAPRLP
jgi:hypothetical protein